MKTLNVSQMENLQGAGRPKCTWEYAGALAGMGALMGGIVGGTIVLGIGMLACE